MEQTKSDDDYSETEAQQRFEAAIRGARIVGHREMKDIARKPRAKPRKAAISGEGRKSPQRGSGAA